MQNPHPLFVHFPIALLSVGAVLELVGLLRKQEGLRRAGHWCLSLGLIGAALAVFTGLRAEDAVAHVDEAHELMETHERLGIVSLTLFALLWLWRRVRGASWSEGEGLSYGIAGLVAAAIMLYGATLGGQLVYDYGVGTALTADADGEDHAHDEEAEPMDEDGAMDMEGADESAEHDDDHDDMAEGADAMVDAGEAGGDGRIVIDTVSMAEAPCHAMPGNAVIMGDCSPEDIARIFAEIQSGETDEMGEGMDMEMGMDMDSAVVVEDPSAGRISIDMVNMAEAPCHAMPNNVIMGACSAEDIARVFDETLAAMGEIDRESMMGADFSAGEGSVVIDLVNMHEMACHPMPNGVIMGSCSGEDVARIFMEMTQDQE